jgi:site-specific recombinase XerD
MRKERSLTIDELIELYELSNRAEGKSGRTIIWYRYILCTFSRYTQQNLGLDDISLFNIDNVRLYVLDLRNRKSFEGHPFTHSQDKPVSSKTVQGHVRALKAFATWLYRDGYTSENRLKNLKVPKAVSRVMEPLTAEEQMKILATARNSKHEGIRNHAIVLTFLDTGQRESELAECSITNLNLEDGYMKVMGKGAKERVVPIGTYCQQTLRNYIDNVRPVPENGEFNNLFLTSTGKPITANTIKLLFHRLAKASGVERLHAHLCRHTFAVNYIMNGGDLSSLKEILGHTTFEMVNHYLHFTRSQITAQHRKYSPMDRLHLQK